MQIKIPKNQKLCVTYKDEHNNPVQIITSDALRTKYYLYDVTKDGSITKVETNNSPIFGKLKIH